MHELLFQATAYLAAATIVVPFAKRFGLGSVLGYLIAGIIIGPFIFGIIGKEHQDVMHVAEFGVVMMLFVIGLELQPSSLWQLRKKILFFGGMQVLGSTVLIFLVASTIFATKAAIAIGLILALSSTAIVLQTLAEKNLLKADAGKNAFTILLFQDLAVIPILAIMPVLGSGTASSSGNWLDSLHPALQGVIILGILAAIVVVGRLAARPLFRFIADTRLREVFTAFALLIVVGIAFLMDSIGLSAALGTFVAGVVLADSEYRHELESVIEPFKGLLLGVFFIAVGASIDFSTINANIATISIGVVSLVLIKYLVVHVICTVANLPKWDRSFLSLALSQGGEFAFVLISFALGAGVLGQNDGSIVVAIVTISMISTPVLLLIHQKLARTDKSESSASTESPNQEKGKVIICGYGRFGQIVSRLLYINGVETVLLDHSPKQIERVKQFGIKVFYGDVTRSDLLEAAGLDDADLFVIAIDNAEQSLQVAEMVKHSHPNLPIMARAIDRGHAIELLKLEVNEVVRETFHSAIHMGVKALKTLGFHGHHAHRLGVKFAQHDQESLHDMAEHWGSEEFVAKAREKAANITALLQEDFADSELSGDQAWSGYTNTKHPEVRDF